MAETHYITTYSGIHFDPVHPRQEDIRMEDIAHSLSLICRGNGQVKQFFSVGQHCIHCALEALARGYSARIALICLLHDASEGYMSDVPRPFKQYLKDYRLWEDKLLSCIYERFLGSDITEEEQKILKTLDNDLLAYDLHYLLNEPLREPLPKLFHAYSYERERFEETEERYLRLYEQLKAQIQLKEKEVAKETG